MEDEEKNSNLLYQQRIWGHGYRKGKAQGYENGFDDGWNDGATTGAAIATAILGGVTLLTTAVCAIFQQKDNK